MDWESLYGNCAQYEERLRAIERERLADRVWARSHPNPWWSLAQLKRLRKVLPQGASHQVRYAAHIGKLTITLSMLVNVQAE